MIIHLQLLPPQTLTLNPHSFLLSSPKPTKNPNPQKHPPNSQTPTFKKRKSQTPLTTTTASTTSGPGNLFRQKTLYLQTLKINPQKALKKNPDFRSTPLETVKSVEHCLYSMGIERSAFRRLFEMFPELLSSNPYTDLYPVFDFLLNDVGLTYPDIRKSILRCPRLLISSVEHQLRPTLLFLQEFGFVGDYKINWRTAVLLVSSVENTLIPKLKFLCELGFDYSEVKTLVLRLPVLLTYSIEKNFRPKVEYFLEEMNGEMWELKRFPQYFAFSLEGRIKPRHRMLAKYGFSLSLPEMLKYSDAQFNVQCLDMRVQLAEEGRLGLENTLIPTLNFLHELGFDYAEVKTMVLRFPGLLAFSIEKFQAQGGVFLGRDEWRFRGIKEVSTIFFAQFEREDKTQAQDVSRVWIALLLPKMLQYSDAEFNVPLIDVRARLADKERSRASGNWGCYSYLRKALAQISDVESQKERHLIAAVSREVSFCD